MVTLKDIQDLSGLILTLTNLMHDDKVSDNTAYTLKIERDLLQVKLSDLNKEYHAY